MATLAELEKKYMTGADLCHEVARLQGTSEQVLLAFSTGKDCLAAWVGIREHFDRVIPFYLYSIPDLEFVQESIRYYEKLLGERILQYPSPMFYDKLRQNVFQSPERLEKLYACNWPKFSYNDVRRIICEDLDLPDELYYATGVRAPDSPMRMTAISSYGPITHSANKFHPVWNWRKAKLIEELRFAGVKLPVDYQLFSRTWDGMDLRFTLKLKEHFPADFRRILEWYPLVEVEISRYEFFLRKQKVDDMRQQGATDEQIHAQVMQMKRFFQYEDHDNG